MTSYKTILIFTIILCIGCNTQESADLVIKNGNYYSASSDNNIKAIAIKGEKIIKIGSVENIENLISTSTQVIDARGQFVMPGFIEGHGHFSGMGKTLQNLNFLKDTSWADIVEKVKSKVATAESGEWIYGRGWHQEKWSELPLSNHEGYPIHYELSDISPDNPVLLVHASGHSVFANEKAMEIAGISKETPDPKGGKIVKTSSKEAIGVFEERAMTPLKDVYNSYLSSLDETQQTNLWYEAIELAQKECIENGITSFQDAGAKFHELERYSKMAEQGKFKMRLWSFFWTEYN